MCEQHLQYLRNAAGAMEIDGDVLSRRLEIAQHRNAFAHTLEIIDRPFDAGRCGNREIVQHRVGRAARRHDERDRVLDRFTRDDVARFQITLDRLYQYAGRFRGRVGFFGVRRRHL